jgi:N-acetylneuraminate lyase
MQFVEGRVWPALLTPLTEQGEPNLEVLDQLVGLMADQQLGGLFVLGSTGQGVLLNPDQRRSVAERAVRAAEGRIPVMIHVGSVATDDAVALARHAAQVGAQAVSSVPPIYYPLRVEATFEHYRRIGSATDLPFYPYHAMFLRQSLPSAKDYAARLLEIPHIAGMKFTDHDLYQMGLIHQYAGSELKILSGADELLCHAALSGAVGAIGTFYNEWGPACQRAREACWGGDLQKGLHFMGVFQRVIDRLLSSGSMWSFHRSAMQAKYGLDIGPPKAPLGLGESPWSEEEVAQLLDAVDAAAE